MIEQSEEAKTSEDAKAESAASQAAEVAVLPVVEAPGISPEPAAAEPVGAADKPVEKPDDPAAVAVSPENGAAESPPPAPSNATQRFRAAAASQIAAARERMSERNKSPVIAVALIAGLTGAAGQAGLATLAQNDRTVWQSQAIENAIAKLDDSISALRSNLERTAEASAAQSAATGERLEKIEKAQLEPTAQIIKLSEAVERLRAANATFASRASMRDAASDVTGSIKSTPSGGKSAGKPAVVEGWTLHDVDRDAALLESKRGLYETYVGDTIPGVGRVEGFRKQDGRWVVVTARGLIVPR